MAFIKTNCAKYVRCGPGEDEAPSHVESAGEILIKELVKKQTNTNITLEQQLKLEKQFERGVGVVALDEITAGTNSLQQFEKRRKDAEAVSELEGRGLSKSEALVLVSGSWPSNATLEAQSAYQQHIVNVQSTSSSSKKSDVLKRRDLELALCVKPNSLETRLYQFAINNATNKPKIEYEAPDHPIHLLPQMAENLMETSDIQYLAKTIRRKRRQMVEALAEPVGPRFKQPNFGKTMWDEIEEPSVVQNKTYKYEKIPTCRKQALYTIKDGKITEIDQKEKNVDKSENDDKEKLSGTPFIALQNVNSVDISERLIEEEIKQLPKFRNYERGSITATLYIKNLSKNITETDLVTIFQRFQRTNENSIIYRLMTGKMRGQAFVRFASCQNAKEALEKTNGIILKGKPMVIQFGKHQDK